MLLKVAPPRTLRPLTSLLGGFACYFRYLLRHVAPIHLAHEVLLAVPYGKNSNSSHALSDNSATKVRFRWSATSWCEEFGVDAQVVLG
ncbi:hypothetical protein ACFXC8_35825, partial [Streptomyces sp. NPDC059441]|uniref:hypothetical protein n=1 Tax=Streptomyces sp. NPDC059441 TaxID=3346829 RepID=UPI003695D13B